MKKNVGSFDQIIRIVLGFGIGIVGLIYQSWWGLIGIIPIATALINFCPLYALFGFSTSKKEK